MSATVDTCGLLVFGICGHRLKVNEVPIDKLDVVRELLELSTCNECSEFKWYGLDGDQ